MSFKNSLDGLIYAYKNEQSLWIHGVCTFFCLLFGFVLKISFNQWAIVIIALAVTLAMELINTAIEATIDLVTTKTHPLAKIAKDTASSATLILSVTAFIGALIIFIPKLMEVIG